MDFKNILLGALVTVLGIVIVVNPAMSIQVAVVILGALLFVSGFLNLIKLLKVFKDKSVRKVIIIRNALSIVVGLLAVTMPFIFYHAITTIIMIMVYVIAVYLLLGACAQIYVVSKLKQEGQEAKYFTKEIIASIIVAVLLILIGQKFAEIVVRIIGSLFIISGIVYIIYSIRHKDLVITPDEVKDADE